MHPDSTVYRLATPADEAEIRALPDGQVPRAFPTVVAERDGEIIGFLGTHDRRDCILAGPLSIALPAGRARGVVAWRLIQTYEFILMQVQGIDSYCFVAEGESWQGAVARASGRTEPFGVDAEGNQWYLRHLPLRSRPDGATVH